MFANEGYGDIVKAKHLIDGDAWTPLSRSAYNGDADTVKALIDTGAEVNTKERDGWSPLHHGAHSGHAGVVNMLIAAGADVNAKERRGYTPLHHSVYNGNVDVVKALIAAGADINANKGNGWTPLFYCGRHSHNDITEALIAAGADVNVECSDGFTPLHRVSFDGNVDCVKALITAGADVNAQIRKEWTALHYAAQTGSADIVKELIAAGAEVDARVDRNGWTPLHVSTQNGHSDVVKALIAAGADINAKSRDGDTPLHSLNAGSKSVRNGLARANLREKVKGRRKIWPETAGCGHADIAKTLIASGADVCLEDTQGMTALHPNNSHTVEVSKTLIKYALLYPGGSNWKTELEKGDGELYRFWEKCEEQIEKMKKTCLGDSSTSFFEYVTETDQNKLALYSSEENFGIKDEAGRDSTLQKFSTYAEDIEAQFNKGRGRANLLHKSQKLMTHFFSCTLFPDITRRISENLTNDDLTSFLLSNDNLE